ncbi:MULTISPECIES: DUF979 domain-containing protein [Novosphingobium]|uniref:DUF979 domain-containing protein n=1 Tax=unclassified Novosphingobium TaxID=2644732 RepID=UPI0012BE0AF7|nr:MULTISPECIES: DUF979 domain-containing protein [unclassified Novosphingobium]MPS69771.1 DUF979 domain-containing protein [Novosphingobium sp.]WRT95029.1 DUF979 domain-containing protein [Novosphingobium sp. RL4]
MIGIAELYFVAGLVFAAFAIASAFDQANPKRWGNAAFWGLVAVSFLFGDLLGDFGNGILVLLLVALAGFRCLGHGRPHTTSAGEREVWSAKLGSKLFLPALVIPVTAFAGTLLFSYSPLGKTGLIDPRWVTLVLLVAGVAIALAATMIWLKPPLSAPVEEGRRLMDSIGWAALLPQMLAALGAVFTAAGVGSAVGAMSLAVLPEGNVFLAVVIFALGMALFTIIMGNAFAAFPVMASAIGVPILIRAHGGDPAVVGAVGMLAGFCGTLLTPMAANFNMVPAALLELKDEYGVIRRQVGTALPLLVCNILILYIAGFLL